MVNYMNRFWKWRNQAEGDGPGARTLYLNGVIAEESWYDDDVTPALFKEELMAGDGDIVVWINSPGGDCIAAAQIYNMLMEYPHGVTVKIDGIAASAASVIAMAGTEVWMSPVSMMMIHNPATVAFGDHEEMQRAIEMLAAVKDSIMNAYEVKTGLGRTKLSNMMDAETWMDAGKAVELGFADGVLQRAAPDSAQELGAADDAESRMAAGAVMPGGSMMYSRAEVVNSLMGKIAEKCRIERPKVKETGRPVDALMERLELLRV